MVSKSRDYLGSFLLLFLMVAGMKWVIEEALHYFAVPSNVISTVTIVGWGILAVISFLFLRNWIVAYRQSNQKEDNSDLDREMFLLNIGRDSDSHSENITGKFRGLYWQLHIRLPKGQTSGLRETDKAEKTHLQYVEGPYCPKDQCRMNEEKTYFGKYRFRCHGCQYKTKKTESSVTLMHDIRETADVKKMLNG